MADTLDEPPAAPLVLTDDPVPHVRRLTLNRPAKRNALSNALRTELFAELRRADTDPEVRVVVVRGAGACFSAGYDLAQAPGEPLPWGITRADGGWARHVLQGGTFDIVSTLDFYIQVAKWPKR